MDSQGAGFAFDADMDFSSVFPTMPQQQQQSFMKPSEDDTSAGFFFGDEGIDTTTGFSQLDTMNPALLSTPQQTGFDMQQSFTMDNTSGSTTAWDAQLTPSLHSTLNPFPPTPIQSFDALYPTTALGKRPLQLDVQDFPQSKRHESMADFTLFPSHSSSATTPSWVEVGLSDEAADVCATWFNKYAMLPSDRHIDSLSQLTGESADAIRSWFGRLLKQGMSGSQSDSAYKSQTALIHPEPFWNDSFSTDIVQVPPPQQPLPQAEITTPEAPFSHDSTIQPATTLRGSKKRCTPTEDRQLLARDANKIYQCTRKCGKRYGRKCDWKRNEEEGYPCKSWICSLCTSEGVENVKPCFRKYHFMQHFRNIHPEIDAEVYEEASVVCSETEFPRKCGFCRHHFVSRQERIDHIADHFKQGKCMLDWKEEDVDDIHDSDNTDDNDDDDRPSEDSFDGKWPSYQPPDSDPRGGPGPKYYGGGGSNGSGGSGGQPGNDGFFQFQLSQLNEGGSGSQPLCANKPSYDDQHIIPTHILQSNQQRPTSEPEDGQQSSIQSSLHGSSSTKRPPLHGRHVPTAKDDKNALARDALPRAIVDQYQTKSQDVQEYDVQALQSCSTTSQSFLSVKLLGAGGFSTVDEVVHRETNLRMGRKTLKNRDQTAIQEIRKEVDVLKKLRHPHVIRFLGAYSNGDKMSILVSPVADTTLALWLERSALQRPANLIEMTTKMFGCLASSVRYLHEQRPVVKHMDIKPQNILIVEGDQEFPHVVLCDFGISSSEDAADGQSKPLTRQYIAPETFEGFTRKQAADIWSLGCVFAEMASVPFSQGNSDWLTFRKEFSGRTGKYYWQDVPDVQDRLSGFLEAATTVTEQTVVRTLKTMLSSEPVERPDAASLTMIFTPAPCCLNWPNDKAIFPGPHEELSGVEMHVHEDGIDCCTQLHVRGCTNEEPDTSLSRAKSWLDECSHSHEACRQQASNGTKLLPTRLVDVLPSGQEESYVRVVNSASIEMPAEEINYVALSHVWNQEHVTLSNDRLQDMLTELPLQTLPKAVNTAISAAQHLGYRYIWVDSLCILQDSEDDKQQECAAMASVFRNAALTVVLDQLTSDFAKAAADVLSTNDNSDRSPLLGSATRRSSKGDRLPASASLPTIDFTTPGFAWDTRAWALQERLLSRRFLHLGEQLYWECNALKASETFPHGLSPLVWEKVHSKTPEGRQADFNEHRMLSTSIETAQTAVKLGNVGATTNISIAGTAVARSRNRRNSGQKSNDVMGLLHQHGSQRTLEGNIAMTGRQGVGEDSQGSRRAGATTTSSTLACRTASTEFRVSDGSAHTED